MELLVDCPEELRDVGRDALPGREVGEVIDEALLDLGRDRLGAATEPDVPEVVPTVALMGARLLGLGRGVVSFPQGVARGDLLGDLLAQQRLEPTKCALKEGGWYAADAGADLFAWLQLSLDTSPPPPRRWSPNSSGSGNSPLMSSSGKRTMWTAIQPLSASRPRWKAVAQTSSSSAWAVFPRVTYAASRMTGRITPSSSSIWTLDVMISTCLLLDPSKPPCRTWVALATRYAARALPRIRSS